MIIRINLIVIAAAIILLQRVAAAQDLGASTGTTAGTVVVVTGCLEKGDQVNEYLLTALDDSKWRIKVPTSIDLTTEVSHLVQVRGVLTNNSEEAAESTSPLQREVTATDFRKVDENCGK